MPKKRSKRKRKKPTFNESLVRRPGKTPRAASTPHPTKTPASPAATDFYQQTPQWSFAVVDQFGPFGWEQLQKSQVEAVLRRLQGLETMTWHEILVQGRKQHHQIEVASCSKAARDRLQALQLDELGELLSLTVSSRARVFGILDRGRFQILWWDPHHGVCPSQKKHT